MEQEAMDMQKLSFFTEGNVFTGSRTKDWSARTMLRYLVRPDKENENCWPGAGRKMCASSWPKSGKTGNFL